LEKPEEMSRRLIDFCGLDWDDRCLKFHENKRTVRTASSWQVRQPLYQTSRERWRNYEKYLGPLVEELSKKKAGEINESPGLWIKAGQGGYCEEAEALMQGKNQKATSPAAEVPSVKANDERNQSAELIRRTMKYYKSGPEVEGLICEILKTDKDTFDTLLMLGIKEGERDGSNLAEAEALIRQALIINKTSAKAFNNLGVILMRRGNLDDAAESYLRAIELKPEEALTYRNYVICRKFTMGDQALEDRLVSLLAEAKIDEDQINFHYALGKIYDDCGRYDDSFRNYLFGNRLERARFKYQWMDTSSLVDRLIEAFPLGYHKTETCAGADSDLPVLVLGMPRSGTTLIEQIISSHPLVFGAGELNGLEEIIRRFKSHLNISYPEGISSLGVEELKNSADYYLKFLRGFSNDSLRITDKMPHNFLHLGLISLLFRNPRVIHCRRDALDTCLSIFFQRFSFKGHPYSYDLEELGHYYYDYERLMAHWQEVLPQGMMLECSTKRCWKDLRR
jgi:tetratricopeptide (TPR) repeat protein